MMLQRRTFYRLLAGISLVAACACPVNSFSVSSLTTRRRAGRQRTIAREHRRRIHPQQQLSRQVLRPRILWSRAGDDKDASPTTSTKISSNKTILIVIAALFSTCILAAVTGLLPGYYTTTTTPDDTLQLSFSLFLYRDMAATALSTVLAYAYVQLITLAHKSGRLASRDARKLIHTGAAPLFLVVWPLFSPAAGARVFASSVAVVNGVRLWLSANKNSDSSSDLATAVSRSGNVEEATGGPLVYCCVLTVAILVFWRTSPVGIVALGVLAAGDGMADVVGRRLGRSNPWWPGSSKSIAGTAAFVVAGSLTSYGLLEWMQYTGCLELASPVGLGTVALITAVSAAVELLPWADDNYTVPISAAIMTSLLIQ